MGRPSEGGRLRVRSAGRASSAVCSKQIQKMEKIKYCETAVAAFLYLRE